MALKESSIHMHEHAQKHIFLKIYIYLENKTDQFWGAKKLKNKARDKYNYHNIYSNSDLY